MAYETGEVCINTKLKIYLISGCCGAGKTTLSRALVMKSRNTALISGDIIHDLYRDEVSMEWTDRLKLVWQNILLLLGNFLENNINVVIDYIIEEEMSQILEVVKRYDVELRYIVLTADRELIRERLVARGDAQLIERALFLHQKLTGHMNNLPYLYNGANVPLEQQIIDVKRFKLYGV